MSLGRMDLRKANFPTVIPPNRGYKVPAMLVQMRTGLPMAMRIRTRTCPSTWMIWLHSPITLVLVTRT
ncbi:MAG: hypothetical protein QOE30_2983 [Mycobacterium sp.]|nr:hypothetical protein [Mycobacterium sp.]